AGAGTNGERASTSASPTHARPLRRPFAPILSGLGAVVWQSRRASNRPSRRRRSFRAPPCARSGLRAHRPAPARDRARSDRPTPPPPAPPGAPAPLGLDGTRIAPPPLGLDALPARPPQQVPGRPPRLPAPQPPRRAVAPARLLEVPAALAQVAHMHVDAEPAA